MYCERLFKLDNFCFEIIYNFFTNKFVSSSIYSQFDNFTFYKQKECHE